MKTAKHLLLLGVALGAAGSASCSIPKPDCTVAQTNPFGAGLTGVAAYAVQFIPQGTLSCPQIKGDVVGMQAYHPASASDPLVRDLSKTSIAIRTQTHGELFWMNEDFGFPTDQDQPNALGDFVSNTPDENDFCQVATAEARVVFPGAQIPEDTGVPCVDTAECTADGGPGGDCTPVDPMDPMAGNTCVITYDFEATDLTYRWSNLQFYVTAAATGSQFTADVEIEVNGCKDQYKAVGMWPAVDCTHLLTGEPDVMMCHPDADPNNTELPRLFGSGINPDFGPVICDTNFGTVPAVDLYTGGYANAPHCALGTETIPALEGFPEITPVP
ncbi:MAG: hypothetical protein R3B70_36305 [Polyangiaceae bacterium]